MMTERTLQILAFALASIAAYFLWQADTEKAFVTGVFAAVSFLLSIRFQIKHRLKGIEATEPEHED